MIDRSVGLLEPLGAVLTDLQQPICKAGALLTADPIQPFTDGGFSSMNLTLANSKGSPKRRFRSSREIGFVPQK